MAHMHTTLTQKSIKVALAATLALPALAGLAHTPAYADTTSNVAKTQVHQGWIKDSHGKWWYGEGSSYVKNKWIKSSGSWYYLKSDSTMAANEWIKDGNKWYLLSANGAMLTGWQKVGGKWYYLNGSGAMETGWLKYKGSWYFLDRREGFMRTGDFADERTGKFYYADSSGAMQANRWIIDKTNTVWRYFGSDGAQVTDKWVWSAGKCYYLQSNGIMATNTTIEAKYYVDKQGVWDGKTRTSTTSSTTTSTGGAGSTTTTNGSSSAGKVTGTTSGGSTTTASTGGNAGSTTSVSGRGTGSNNNQGKTLTNLSPEAFTINEQIEKLKVRIDTYEAEVPISSVPVTKFPMEYSDINITIPKYERLNNEAGDIFDEIDAIKSKIKDLKNPSEKNQLQQKIDKIIATDDAGIGHDVYFFDQSLIDEGVVNAATGKVDNGIVFRMLPRFSYPGRSDYDWVVHKIATYDRRH